MVIDPLAFKDKNHRLGFKNETTTDADIPAQVIPGDPINLLIRLMGLTQLVSNTVIYGNLILHPLLMFSLSLVWGLVNGL